MSYTKAHFDFESLPQLTSPRKVLETKSVALGLINLKPNVGYTFTHYHRVQEEVYIVIKGDGVILINNELISIISGDIIRVSPEEKRALKANNNGMIVICTGSSVEGYPKNPNARYQIDDGFPDYNDIPPWYKDDDNVKLRNKMLQKRMDTSKNKHND
jgi:mannose-6-phosphate isomerase-like protein (cupin superfamily)